LAAARCRSTEGLKRSRSTQVAIRLARAPDTIGPLQRPEWYVRAEVVLETNGAAWVCVCLIPRRKMVVTDRPRR
jgi:hypothetical protein